MKSGNLGLILFVLCLLVSLIAGFQLYWAIAAGLLIFSVFAMISGIRFKDVLTLIWKGFGKSLNVLEVLCLIGILTASWRASGTIPLIVSFAADLIVPDIFLILAFFFNCAVSFMTGTSFGTVATMGTICMTIAGSIGISPILAGGAVISGIWFGDRCSPVSSSALLSAEITDTDIYTNVRLMAKSALIPFAVSCLLYLLLGLSGDFGNVKTDLFSLFGREFRLDLVVIIPAVLILLLAVFRVPSKIAIAASIASAVVIGLTVQSIPFENYIRYIFTGFTAEDPEVALMTDGGGILSIKNSLIIVALSCSYSELFEATGILEGVRRIIQTLGKKLTPYTGMLIASVFSSMLACNQTFAQIMTFQLCGSQYEDKQQCLLDIEDTAVIVAPMIPWTVACVIPLSTLGTDTRAMFCAFYLWLIPIFRLIKSFIDKKKA